MAFVWNRRATTDTPNIRSIRADADGNALILSNTGARLWTSTNYGAAWTERQPAGAANLGWWCATIDNDGTFFMAGINAGRLYTSSDSGANWTERQPAGAADKSWGYGA